MLRSLSILAVTLMALTAATAGYSQTDIQKEKTKQKAEQKNSGDGGAGVNPGTVKGCQGTTCFNNPPPPKEPTTKCRKVNGIEMCF